jgi:uncharacterized membrane protein YeaQ/YmgE (transglycosylase-associated protein family)
VTIFQFILLLVVAGIAGGIGQSLAGYSHGGCLASTALGFVGALLGSWIARIMGLPTLLVVDIGPERFPLVWAILGAALFVGLLGILTRPSDRVR